MTNPIRQPCAAHHSLSSSRPLTYAALSLAVVLVAATCAPATAVGAPPPLSVPSATLTTMDGVTLWSSRPTAKRRVASTIKMLNALVVMERASLDDVVTVSAKAAGTSDGVGLVAGQQLTVRQLLEMMLVASANDAAEALAIHIGGSEAKYVELMNAKARQLGLKNTTAVDPHGLSKRERSTAADLAVIARHLMADPTLREIVKQRSVTVPGPTGGSATVGSTDELLGRYAGIEGVKTGYTDPAGYCFVGAAKRGDVELLGVVLGAGSKEARFSETRKLLDWGFAHYRLKPVLAAGEAMGAVAVGEYPESTVTVHAARSVSVPSVDDSGTSKVTTDVWLPRSVSAPVQRGQQVGAVQVRRDGVLVDTVPLLADEGVAVAPPEPEPVAAPPAPPPSVWERMSALPARLWHALVARPAPA